jgi:hypothetical protein
MERGYFWGILAKRGKWLRGNDRRDFSKKGKMM